MKLSPLPLILYFAIPLTLVSAPDIATSQSTKEIPQAAIEANSKCFKCHGNEKYSYFNEWTEKNVLKYMNPYYVLDSTLFYSSNHKTFQCIDCHSPDYESFPHSGELRMEPISTCLDCHEGDENTAQYHFESIQEEHEKSVHSDKFSESFSCWMCHDAHSYTISARKDTLVRNVVAYDNSICLNCHANQNRFSLLSASDNYNIIAKHDWLPNQRLHFLRVRCIECHSIINDSLLVAHNVRPKEEAVKNCVECHSENTLLTARLYRYQFGKASGKYGFLNAEILDDAYVIGATRNYLLNITSFIIFLVTIGVIGIHVLVRIIKRR